MRFQELEPDAGVLYQTICWRAVLGDIVSSFFLTFQPHIASSDRFPSRSHEPVFNVQAGPKISSQPVQRLFDVDVPVKDKGRFVHTYCNEYAELVYSSRRGGGGRRP